MQHRVYHNHLQHLHHSHHPEGTFIITWYFWAVHCNQEPLSAFLTFSISVIQYHLLPVVNLWFYKGRTLVSSEFIHTHTPPPPPPPRSCDRASSDVIEGTTVRSNYGVWTLLAQFLKLPYVWHQNSSRFLWGFAHVSSQPKLPHPGYFTSPLPPPVVEVDQQGLSRKESRNKSNSGWGLGVHTSKIVWHSSFNIKMKSLWVSNISTRTWCQSWRQALGKDVQ